MKFKLDVLRHLPQVYPKFEIVISKHVEKVWKIRTDGDGQTSQRYYTTIFQTGV